VIIVCNGHPGESAQREMKVNLLQRRRDAEKKLCELRVSVRDFHISCSAELYI